MNNLTESILSCMLLIFSVWMLIKGLFWSGAYPPNRGWTRRQLARMEQHKSPWTLICFITYNKERNREIQS